MTSIRFLVPMLALFSLAACSGSSTATDKSATPVTAAEGAGPEGMHHRGPPPGPEGLLFAALHEPLNLTDAQRAKIQAAVDELHPKGPPPGMEEHRKAVAAAVRAGKIDVAALAPKGPTEAQLEERRAALAKAISVLHDTLSKDQRVALVDAITKHRVPMGPPPDGDEGPKGEGPKGPPPGGPGMGPGMGPKGPGMGPGMGPKGPMHHMLGDLDLTQEQKDAIHAKMQAKMEANKPTEAERKAMHEQHEAMRKELDARLQTFVADTFDAKAFVTPPAGAKPPAMRDHRLELLEVVVSVLTPAQREKLAQKIEAGPPAPPAK